MLSPISCYQVVLLLNLETQRKLIVAAEQVMREKGAKALKVDLLTTMAECSTGSFYNLFKDRKAIIPFIL